MLLHRLRRAADSSFEEKAPPPYIGPPCELPVVDPEDPICVEPRRRRERRERCTRQKKSGFRFTCSCCCCAVGLLVICAFAITGRLIISHTLESRTSWHRPESSGVNDSENDTDSNVTAVPSMANSSAAEGAPVSTGDAPLNATSQNFLEAPSDVDVNVTESNGTGLPDSVSNNTEAAPSVNTSMANSSAAEGEPVATNDAPHNATSQNLSEAAPSDVGVNFTESNGTGLTDSTSSDTDAATSVNASVANSSAAEVAPVTDDEPDNATSQNLSESLSDVGVNVTESNGTSLFSPASNTTEAAQGVTVSVTDSTTGAELSDVYYGYGELTSEPSAEDHGNQSTEADDSGAGAEVGGTGSTLTTPMLSTTATSAWPSTSPFSNISSASNTQTTTLFSTTTTTTNTASTTTARTTTAGFFGLNGTSTTSTTGKFTTATTTKLSTPVSSNGTSTTNTWTTLFTTSPQPASAQTTTASTFVTTTTSTAFQPSGPLVAMPNCFLAPLVEKTGCQRLMVEEDARFGLNELQQETTARRICQESARALGANTWQFRVGRCEVWNCSSKAALQRSADSGRSGTEGLLLQDYKGRIVATGKEELVAEYDFVESLAVVVIQNPDSTAYLQGADGSYITMGLAVGLQQEAARWSLSAADDGVALFVEGQQLVVRSSRLELQPPAGAGAEGIFHLVPAGLQRAWGPDARVWVHSSWCQYQEPYGGEGGRQRRSATYVQLFEWSHAAVAKECQQLGAQGVDGVQLSPVTEHVVGDQWWVRYQPVSFSLNSRSGSAADLRHAVAACRSAGVEVVADVVLNHMARPCPEAENARLGTPCVGWNGTAYGNRRTAGARGWDRANTSFFHHQTGHDTWGQCGVGPETGFLCGSPVTTDCSCCPCDMYGLPDWDLAEPAVQEMHTRHLEELHSMGITMLRVDAALYMESDLMSGILNRFPWDMVYQEWWHELPVPGREVFGLYRDLKFMRRAAEEMHDAAQVLNLQQGNFYIPAEDAVYPTCFQDGRSDAADPTVPTFKNGLAFHQQQKFLLASPFPTTVVLWSGYSWQSIEQGPPGGASGEECMATPSASPLPLELASSRRWVCEHRWQGVAGLVHFRKACRKAITKSWAGACVGCGALRLGAGCFLALAGPDGWQLRLTTGLPGGRYCDLSSLENRTCMREVLLGDEGHILEGGVPAGDLLAISTTWML